MRKLGKWTVLVMIFGFFVAANRLAAQGTPASEVFTTGALVVAGLVLLFGVLLGFGKLMQALTGGEGADRQPKGDA